MRVVFCLSGVIDADNVVLCCLLLSKADFVPSFRMMTCSLVWYAVWVRIVTRTLTYYGMILRTTTRRDIS